MDKNVILVGGFSEIIELCEDCNLNIVGVIDQPDWESAVHSYPLLGQDKDALSLYKKYSNCKIVISPDSPVHRQKLYIHYQQYGFEFATIISPYARISRSAKIGEGCVIQSGVNVSSNCVLGKFIKINTNANIMHDNIIGNFTTIAPNAVLLGKVNTGERSYIGANSTVLSNINIGNDSTIGASAVVTRDVEQGITVRGIPAKKM